MVGVAGVSEGEGPGLSARIVDNAASGRSRSRAWTGGRASVPRPFGAVHCVQDPRRGGTSFTWAIGGGELTPPISFEQSEDRMSMSRKKHDTTPVAEAAELARPPR